MKWVTYLMMIGLFVFVLAACTESTSENVEGMIDQGDEIDDMVFTNRP